MASFTASRTPSRPPGLIRRTSRSLFLNRRRFATGAAAVIAVGLAYHVVFGQNGLTVYQQKRLDAIALQVQMNDLTRENGDLKSHVDRLQNDPSAIEHQAREELHYTRPGEVIYTLPPESPASAKH